MALSPQNSYGKVVFFAIKKNKDFRFFHNINHKTALSPEVQGKKALYNIYINIHIKNMDLGYFLFQSYQQMKLLKSIISKWKKWT